MSLQNKWEIIKDGPNFIKCEGVGDFYAETREIIIRMPSGFIREVAVLKAYTMVGKRDPDQRAEDDPNVVEENAKLIRAAPEMLALLLDIRARLQVGAPVNHRWITEELKEMGITTDD